MVGKIAYLGSKDLKTIISEALQFMHILDENLQIKSLYPKKSFGAARRKLHIMDQIQYSNPPQFMHILDHLRQN